MQRKPTASASSRRRNDQRHRHPPACIYSKIEMSEEVEEFIEQAIEKHSRGTEELLNASRTLICDLLHHFGEEQATNHELRKQLAAEMTLRSPEAANEAAKLVEEGTRKSDKRFREIAEKVFSLPLPFVPAWHPYDEMFSFAAQRH
ncbi:hypothetical protein QOT17_000701 [Balamuthia mandrillaris]